MEEFKSREIPLKNYIILGVVIVISILLLYYFYMWFNVYNNTRLSTPILNDYVEVINYNELDDYLVENPNAIIYVSVLKDNEIRNFENKFKNVIRNNKLNREILYMDITDELGDEIIRKELNKKYSINASSITNVPAIVVFDNGILKAIYNVKDNNYDMSKVKIFINGVKFSNEEEIDD